MSVEESKWQKDKISYSFIEKEKKCKHQEIDSVDSQGTLQRCESKKNSIF